MKTTGRHGYQYGFTLLEMILAIVIGATIISLSYQVYNMINREWDNYYNVQNKLIEVSLFKEVLNRDIEKSSVISLQDDHTFDIIVEDDTIFYSIGNAVVRKHKGLIDSFNIKTDNLKFSYISCNESMQVINEIKFDLIDPIDIKEVLFKKRYTSEELLTVCRYGFE